MLLKNFLDEPDFHDDPEGEAQRDLAAILRSVADDCDRRVVTLPVLLNRLRQNADAIEDAYRRAVD